MKQFPWISDTALGVGSVPLRSAREWRSLARTSYLELGATLRGSIRRKSTSQVVRVQFPHDRSRRKRSAVAGPGVSGRARHSQRAPPARPPRPSAMLSVLLLPRSAAVRQDAGPTSVAPVDLTAAATNGGTSVRYARQSPQAPRRTTSCALTSEPLAASTRSIERSRPGRRARRAMSSPRSTRCTSPCSTRTSSVR